MHLLATAHASAPPTTHDIHLHRHTHWLCHSTEPKNLIQPDFKHRLIENLNSSRSSISVHPYWLQTVWSVSTEL